MNAVYRGDVVRVVRLEAVRAYVVWRGMLKRVNRAELEGLQ